MNKIDGHDIRPSLFGNDSAGSPYEAFFYYRRRQLQAVRWGHWKLHLDLMQTHPNWTSPEKTGKPRPGRLVNLETDLQERTDLSTENPEVMAKMQKLVARAVATLGNNAQRGSEQRPAHTLENSAPMVLTKYSIAIPARAP